MVYDERISELSALCTDLKTPLICTVFSIQIIIDSYVGRVTSEQREEKFNEYSSNSYG